MNRATIALNSTTPEVHWEFCVMRTDRTRVTGLTTAELDVRLYGPDDAEDSASEAITEIGFGVYRVAIPLSEFVSGLGSYIMVPTSTDADHVFEPNAGQAVLGVYYFQVTAASDAANFTLGSVYPAYTGTFKRAFLTMLTGNVANETEELSSFDGGTGAVVLKGSGLSTTPATDGTVLGYIFPR